MPAQRASVNVDPATSLSKSNYTSARTMAGTAPSPGPGMLLADTSDSTLLLELPGVLMPGNVYAGKMSGASWCNLGTRCSTLCTCVRMAEVSVK